MVRRTCAQKSTRSTGYFLTCVLCCSCSYLLETNKRQCDADADCSARGLTAKCVANLCQAISLGPPAGSTSVREETAGAMGVSTEQPDPASGGASGTTDVSEGGAPAVKPPTGGSGGKLAVASAGTRAPAAGATACEGSSCPECSTDADCQKHGGGTCVNKACFKVMHECNTDKDCETHGAEYTGGRCMATQCLPNPKWRCEPLPMWPASTGNVDMIIPVVDALSFNRVPNVKIVACNKLDLTCASPVTMDMTGTNVEVKLSVPNNFSGYVQQTDRPQYAPAMYFLPAGWPEDGRFPNFPLLPSGVIIQALAATLGGTIDPMRGHMILIAVDCQGNTLPGITFTSPQMDKSTIQFYVRDGAPSTTVKDTPSDGDGGYLNFPTGTALITVHETKLNLDLATASVLVRPGFISVAYIRPMSRDAN